MRTDRLDDTPAADVCSFPEIKETYYRKVTGTSLELTSIGWWLDVVGVHRFRRARGGVMGSR